MNDLTEFLLARVAEDEAVARGALDVRNPGYEWEATQVHDRDYGAIDEVSLHPARVLAECEAKRRIVEEHPPTDPIDRDGTCYCQRCLGQGTDVGYPDEWVQAWHPCPTLRLLAAIYADHPDYREEWRA